MGLSWSSIGAAVLVTGEPYDSRLVLSPHAQQQVSVSQKHWECHTEDLPSDVGVSETLGVSHGGLAE